MKNTLELFKHSLNQCWISNIAQRRCEHLANSVPNSFESAMAQIGKKQLRADAVDAMLNDQDFRAKTKAAYEENARWQPYPDAILSWAIQALLSGQKSAVALARRQGKNDWEEVDAQYKAELSSAVPETWSDLEEEINEGDADFHALAKYFEAVDSCARCGAEIIHFDSLVESITSYYQLSEDDEGNASDLINEALNATDMEDAEGSCLCNYCSYMTSKDD